MVTDVSSDQNLTQAAVPVTLNRDASGFNESVRDGGLCAPSIPYQSNMCPNTVNSALFHNAYLGDRMPAQQKKKQIEYQGYCQVSIDEADIKVLEASEVSADEFVLWIASMTRNLYRLVITSEGPGTPTRVTVQDVSESRPSKGWMLSGEGENLIDALLVLRYKHEVKMGNNWIPFLVSTHSSTRFR